MPFTFNLCHLLPLPTISRHIADSTAVNRWYLARQLMVTVDLLLIEVVAAAETPHWHWQCSEADSVRDWCLQHAVAGGGSGHWSSPALALVFLDGGPDSSVCVFTFVPETRKPPEQNYYCMYRVRQNKVAP